VSSTAAFWTQKIANFLLSIKPTLKKVSKYENKFAKLQKKAAEFNFRNQLKTVKKKEFTMDEEEAGVTLKATFTCKQAS